VISPDTNTIYHDSVLSKQTESLVAENSDLDKFVSHYDRGTQHDDNRRTALKSPLHISHKSFGIPNKRGFQTLGDTKGQL